jgi:hypothetical protein
LFDSPAMPVASPYAAVPYGWLQPTYAPPVYQPAPQPSYGYAPDAYAPTSDVQVASLQQQLAAIDAQLQALLQGALAQGQQLYQQLFQPATPPAPAPQPQPVPAPAGRGQASFNIGSFNVLGNSHTTAGGEKPQMASGPARMHKAVQLIQEKHLDVVGFQEFQAVQAKEFNKLVGKQYGLFHAKGDTVNSIAWNKAKFDFVSGSTYKIPYFNGHMVSVPIVRLRDKQTGKEAYFMNVHNPADTYRFHHQQAYRERATQIEADTINRLKASGLPIFFTGDMNEHEPWFDRLTARTPMVTANDAKTRAHGIDWITATPGVHFDHFQRDRSAFVQATTDHPVVTAHASY